MNMAAEINRLSMGDNMNFWTRCLKIPTEILTPNFLLIIESPYLGSLDREEEVIMKYTENIPNLL